MLPIHIMQVELVETRSFNGVIPVPPGFKLKEQALMMHVEYNIVNGKVEFSVWVSSVNGTVRLLALQGALPYVANMDMVSEIMAEINRDGKVSTVVGVYEEAMGS